MTSLVKSKKEIELMREGGRRLAEIRDTLAKEVEPGITTDHLNRIAEKFIEKAGAKPAFLGYHGFPAVICASVNEQIVHTPPSSRVLQEGDILSIDIAMHYPAEDGLVTDTAVTVPVGKISQKAGKLIEATHQALEVATQKCRPGITTGELGGFIQDAAKDHGFFVIKELIGHGIGYKMHEAPAVPNFKMSGANVKLESGMTIAVEPMLAEERTDIKQAEDGLTYLTKGGSLSAHFEHTILITNTAPEILTIP